MIRKIQFNYVWLQISNWFMVETKNSIDLCLITKTNLILFDFINPMDYVWLQKYVLIFILNKFIISKLIIFNKKVGFSNNKIYLNMKGYWGRRAHFLLWKLHFFKVCMFVFLSNCQTHEPPTDLPQILYVEPRYCISWVEVLSWMGWLL